MNDDPLDQIFVRLAPGQRLRLDALKQAQRKPLSVLIRDAIEAFLSANGMPAKDRKNVR